MMSSRLVTYTLFTSASDYARVSSPKLGFEWQHQAGRSMVSNALLVMAGQHGWTEVKVVLLRPCVRWDEGGKVRRQEARES